MSVTLNSSSGAVVISPDVVTAAQFLAADQSNATTTLATIPTFTLALGKGERMVANYYIHYNISAATADLTYRIYTVDQTTPATGVTPQFLRVVGGTLEPSGTAYTPNLGTGDVTTTVTTANTGNGFVNVRVVVVNNATTNSNLIFQFAPAGVGTDIVYAGSYVEYRRF